MQGLLGGVTNRWARWRSCHPAYLSPEPRCGLPDQQQLLVLPQVKPPPLAGSPVDALQAPDFCLQGSTRPPGQWLPPGLGRS